MKFPPFEFPLRTKKTNNVACIYDPLRKKFLVLTPEEWVRQHVIYLLLHEKNISKGRIAVERAVANTAKRFDLLVHEPNTGKPQLIIECKAYNEPVNQSTFDQIGRYNLSLKVPYLIVTNWKKWMAAEINHQTKEVTFLSEFPSV